MDGGVYRDAPPHDRSSAPAAPGPRSSKSH